MYLSRILVLTNRTSVAYDRILLGVSWRLVPQKSSDTSSHGPQPCELNLIVLNQRINPHAMPRKESVREENHSNPEQDVGLLRDGEGMDEITQPENQLIASHCFLIHPNPLTILGDPRVTLRRKQVASDASI